jgi:hypothetical protein
MPIHDWTRVRAGTFHDFHCTWTPEIKNRLNRGILPADYYAQVEQSTGDAIADVLTLRTESDPRPGVEDAGGGAVIAAPPRVRYSTTLKDDAALYALRARRVVVRRGGDDQIVALLEVLSPGNKTSQNALRRFVDKAETALQDGYHLLLIDLFPPTSRDPRGIHGAIWEELGGEPYEPPPDKPLTQVAYSADWPARAYIEPMAVGDALTAMPLFLTPDRYVPVPLEETYMAAYQGVPRRWQSVLE